MEINKSIYKKDSKGKIRVLHISTLEGDLIQKSGLIDGKLVEHISSSKAKNKGKVNETTSQEQATLEAKSKIKKKLDEGYFETQNEAENEDVILPMLAKSYDKEKGKIDWDNAYVQPKLDGMRCLKKGDKMISRKNKNINTLPHIMKEKVLTSDYMDGELYCYGLSFQENMKLIKKNRPDSINVSYHVYDMVYPNLPFTNRLTLLKHLVKDKEHIKLVPTYKVNSMNEVKQYHTKFIGEGYEGTMIRWGDEGYKVNGRSSNLLKYKDFNDITLKVKNVIPNDKNPSHGSFIFDWEGASGHPLGENILGCGMKFSHEDRESILKNKEEYIGETVELRFFEYSDTGVPRFPVCVGLRLDK